MGGAVSTGRNNDDLVDNLLSADYIRTPAVQKLFRAVDRGDYFLPQFRKNAYKDLAWKHGNLHLSAPCIYSEVMEGLCLKPSLSFLNLGSGTGYLSTMVGLAIGNSGINHGIEMYPDVIEFANRKLEEFKRYSSAVDEYDFSEPKFIQGNCLCLSSDTLQYDRVYCGGACPGPYITYVKNLIKVHGILVMPVEDQLMQIERTSETTWEERSLLPVSFATLLAPADDLVLVLNIDMEPSSLQEICRTVVRNVLRHNINKENPKLSVPPKKKHVSKRKHSQKRTIPHLDSSDEGSEGEVGSDRCSEHSNHGNQNRSIGAFINIVLGRTPETRQSLLNANNSVSSNDAIPRNDTLEPHTRVGDQETDNNHEVKADVSSQKSGINQNSYSTDVLEELSNDTTRTETVRTQMSNDTRRTENVRTQPSRSLPIGLDNDTFLARIMIRKRNRDDGIEEGDEDSDEDWDTEKVSSKTPSKTKTTEIVSSSATKTKREKFDSGLGDEIVGIPSDGEAETAQETDGKKNEMDIDSSSSSDEDNPKNSTCEYASLHPIRGRHWRTVTVPSYAVDHLIEHLDDEIPEEELDQETPQRVVGPYTILMRDKIQELPLPQTLKNYLNYYKEF